MIFLLTILKSLHKKWNEWKKESRELFKLGRRYVCTHQNILSSYMYVDFFILLVIFFLGIDLAITVQINRFCFKYIRCDRSPWHPHEVVDAELTPRPSSLHCKFAFYVETTTRVMGSIIIILIIRVRRIHCTFTQNLWTRSTRKVRSCPVAGPRLPPPHFRGRLTGKCLGEDRG